MSAHRNVRIRPSLNLFIMLSILAITLIAMVIVGVRIYGFYMEQMRGQVYAQFNSIVENNVRLIDQRLKTIRERTNVLVTDMDLYETMEPLKKGDEVTDTDILTIQRKLVPLLKRFFDELDLYTVELATDRYVFNNSLEKSVGVTTSRYLSSELYQKAQDLSGIPFWQRTYSFSEMFGDRSYRGISTEYEYLFSYVRTIGRQYFYNGRYYTFDFGRDQPVLIVSLKPSYFDVYFSGNMPLETSVVRIVTAQGERIYCSDPASTDDDMEAALVRQILLERSADGYISGEDPLIYCRGEMKETGWKVILTVPDRSLGLEMSAAIQTELLRILLIILIVTIVVATVFRRYLMRPIFRLQSAFQQMGEGHFGVQIEENTYKELKDLLILYNDMGRRVQRLVHENYEVKLSEQEFEIAALNQQMDPHFLYNTLNIIGWLIDEGEYDKTREMIITLSRMLRYTAKNSESVSTLSEDLAWMTSYVYILSVRFERAYQIHVDVPEEFLSFRVPKLFLQPFVENAILHGFKGRKAGNVRISAYIREDDVVFEVADDGNGMAPERVASLNRRLAAPSPEDTGTIGMHNANRRIRLLYGEEYGVFVDSQQHQYTSVRIRLPLSGLSDPHNFR